MPRSEYQKLKLFYIIEIFCKFTDEKHHITVGEIINMLAEMGIKAERKSIYRDMEMMGELGYEIVQIHNKRFEYYLANREFTTEELKMIVDAIQTSKFITKKKTEELIRKLEGLTTMYDSDYLERPIFNADRTKTLSEAIYCNIDTIHKAMRKNVEITFMYFDWDVNKKRVFRHNKKVYCLSPWSLVWYNENYYVLGYNSEYKKIQHFRVNRMANIKLTDDEREGRKSVKKISVTEYAKSYFNTETGKSECVVLKCDKSTANAVIDKFGTNIKFVPQKDKKGFYVTVETVVNASFFAWVFMFGGRIKIESPKETAEKLTEMAKKISGDNIR